MYAIPFTHRCYGYHPLIDRFHFHATWHKPPLITVVIDIRISQNETASRYQSFNLRIQNPRPATAISFIEATAATRVRDEGCYCYPLVALSFHGGGALVMVAGKGVHRGFIRLFPSSLCPGWPPFHRWSSTRVCPCMIHLSSSDPIKDSFSPFSFSPSSTHPSESSYNTNPHTSPNSPL